MRMRSGVAALFASAALSGLSVQAVAASAEAGARIYGNYCENCHGQELQNTSQGVTFDLRKLRPDEHERFINSVTNGKKQMPPWKGVLDEDKMESVWAYIRSINDKK
jgi:mono/diheme cytochrome c family protein